MIYIADWEKFYENFLTEKEDFYSHLDMEDSTYAEFVKILK